MTAAELGKMIGQKLTHSFGGLDVRVEVVDAKESWGRRRLLVKVDGQELNAVWIEK